MRFTTIALTALFCAGCASIHPVAGVYGGAVCGTLDDIRDGGDHYRFGDEDLGTIIGGRAGVVADVAEHFRVGAVADISSSEFGADLRMTDGEGSSFAGDVDIETIGVTPMLMAYVPIGRVAPYVAAGPHISEVDLKAGSAGRVHSEQTSVGLDARGGIQATVAKVGDVSIMAFVEYRYLHSNYEFSGSTGTVDSDLETHSGIFGLGVEF